ncbi:MAG: hypothetical protein AAF593_02675 [Planctomycetota bacterium]
MPIASFADLWGSLAAVTGLAVLFGVLGWWAGRSLGRVGITAVIVGLMSATVAYLWLGRDAALWAKLMPVSGVVILSNPTPWLAAGMGGMCLAQGGLPWWRRGLLAAVLVGAGYFVPIQLLWAEPPPTVPTWIDGVAIQTTSATCSPAAATTLLTQHGIETSERQMAELCLTNAEGTPLLGLYRGVAQIARPHGLRPSMEFLTLEELQDRPELLPAVVSVELTLAAHILEPRYRDEWGWILGTRHSVTFLAFDGPDHVWVADPGVGKERWRLSHTRDLWVGDVLSLVPVHSD